MNHLGNLNDEQKKAVLQTEGPVLILAGAGAGKTRVLTHRVLHLIKNGVVPHNILAITFTNKAAKEMRERVLDLIKNDKELNIPITYKERPMVSTFHSLGVQLLRENCRELNIARNFKIYDRNDSKRAVKKAVVEEGFDPKEHEPGKLLSIISNEKGKMVTFEEFEAGVGNDFKRNLIARVWKRYEKSMSDEKALDFDDLLLRTALALKNNQKIREYYQDLWKYIHIDEYQDTNKVQYQIVKMLADKHHNICVVGDIDQNIYSWRGATIKNIMNFEKDYPEAEEIILEQNYRSTQTILTAANDVIKKNKVRREKNLFTENKEGEKIVTYSAYDENDEARFVSEKVETILEGPVKPSDIAILYRANFQSRVLEEAFLHNGVPYQVLGTRFFDRKEIKDIVSFIQTALNPSDLSSLGRVINVPPRGIGKVTFLKIAEGNEAELKGATKEKMMRFRKFLTSIADGTKTTKPSELIKFILKGSGLEENFKNGGDEGQERLENVKELATLATKYDELPFPEGVEKLLEDSALATDQDELQNDNGGVKLMTVHASKGLEFDYVFVTGLEDGLFPHERLGSKKEDSEEERRLFYVAITRACKQLFLSYASVRTIFGSRQMNVQSEFIGDIDEELIEGCGDEIADAVKDIFIDF